MKREPEKRMKEISLKICLYFECFRSYADREGSDFLFVVDAEAHIDNPSTLIRLVEQNRWVKNRIVALRFEIWTLKIEIIIIIMNIFCLTVM